MSAEMNNKYDVGNFSKLLEFDYAMGRFFLPGVPGAAWVP